MILSNIRKINDKTGVCRYPAPFKMKLLATMSNFFQLETFVTESTILNNTKMH